MTRDRLSEAAEVARTLRDTDRLSSALRLGGWVLDEVLPAGRTISSAARAMSIAPSTLHRYVAIAQLCRRLGREGFDHLGVSHLKLVLAVPEAQQEALVAVAEAERWTVARVRQAIRAGTGPEQARTGLQRLLAWAASPQRRDEPGALEGEDAAEMLEIVRALRTDLEWLEERLVRAADPGAQQVAEIPSGVAG